MNIAPEITSDFTFCRREEAVPVDNRKLWRLSALCLSLSYCRSKRSSLKKLQLLNWAIRSKDSQKVLSLFFQENISEDSVVIRFDPGFPVTLNLMIAIEFCVLKGKSVTLTDKGVQFALQIEKDAELMVSEKNFLKEVKPFFTEKRTLELLAKII